LLRWHAEVGTFPLGSSQEADPAVASLAEVLDGVARDDAPELFAKHSGLRFEVGNVISRDFTDHKVGEGASSHLFKKFSPLKIK
jgi:hypothetical protein